VQALGLPLPCGHLHPLLKVRTQFRKLFTQMGFTEMPTNNYVESSFWNFDALFQPQQHPARDAHDTFFLTQPATTPAASVPAEYMAKVKAMHESGGFGSVGYAFGHPDGTELCPCRLLTWILGSHWAARTCRSMPRLRHLS
jgi:phenylalanyl-tRNA synthetase alpha chain